jgi:aminobenzoyl-glutamate utilization protein B
MRFTLSLTVALVTGFVRAEAQAPKQQVAASLDRLSARYAELAREIWGFAEVGYQEERSTRLLQDELRSAGFRIQTGVAEIPTAFIATYGSGRPVIGILAEFDALPGLSQAVATTRRPLAEGGPGHGCGHHLFGTASTAAAIAVKEWLAQSGRSGTIRVYGTPAEEGGSGKVYMVRAGLFNDVDAVIHWHPGDRNDASQNSSLANKSAKFRFRGQSAHAAGAPDRGRSALDGVEAMTFMLNLMREHVPEKTRIHYVITRGGGAPNVVPDFAELFLYTRYPTAEGLQEIWQRVEQAARGAAMGTGTDVDWEIIHGNHSLLPNTTLGRVMDANLRALGGIEYTPEERRFAEEIRATLGQVEIPLGSETSVQPYGETLESGSTDVGDVSWTVPTVGLNTATWVPGTAAHSWQAVAAGGMSIGSKGMMLAARAMAATAIDLYTTPRLLAEAKAEFERRRGADFAYVPLIGNRAPPLDYRK